MSATSTTPAAPSSSIATTETAIPLFINPFVRQVLLAGNITINSPCTVTVCSAISDATALTQRYEIAKVTEIQAAMAKYMIVYLNSVKVSLHIHTVRKRPAAATVVCENTSTLEATMTQDLIIAKPSARSLTTGQINPVAPYVEFGASPLCDFVLQPALFGRSATIAYHVQGHADVTRSYLKWEFVYTTAGPAAATSAFS
jgi:hypothetical protein